jgi:hypothetical protein
LTQVQAAAAFVTFCSTNSASSVTSKFIFKPRSDVGGRRGELLDRICRRTP